MTIKIADYRWPDLSLVVRQFIVIDERGRYGIAQADARTIADGTIFARPINLKAEERAGAVSGAETIPAGANTAWHWEDGLGYIGHWCDEDDYPSHIKPEDYGRYMRRLSIVEDLGYVVPDRWLELLSGLPANQPQRDMTVQEAEDFARAAGEPVTARAIRHAARAGYIPGARKSGRDWLIPYGGFGHYLDNRPRPGRNRGG